MKRRLIDWDPWTAIDPEVLRDNDQVDADLVMDPTQVIAIARRCGTVDPRYEPFVLAMGQSGLRPSEAINVRRRDLDLADISDAAFIVRTSYTTAPDRFLVEGESRDRPLKGRGPKARRRVPIPTSLARRLREHLDRYVDDEPDAFVFANSDGGRIDLSNFSRDVWNDAREALFPAGSPLRRVRRHTYGTRPSPHGSTPASPSRPPNSGADTAPPPSSSTPTSASCPTMSGSAARESNAR